MLPWCCAALPPLLPKVHSALLHCTVLRSLQPKVHSAVFISHALSNTARKNTPCVVMQGVQQQVEHCSEQLAREPMFCMETAIKCFYWTRLAKLYGVRGCYLGVGLLS